MPEKLNLTGTGAAYLRVSDDKQTLGACPRIRPGPPFGNFLKALPRL
jgi:hypothetical protein